MSAIGGAGLVFLGQVAIEEYRASRQTEREVVQAQKKTQERRAERADTYFAQYQELAEQADRAAEFVATGRSGSREDLLAVIRHFRGVIAGIHAERADPDEIALLYGGRLAFWSDELEKLGRGRSPVANGFTVDQRDAYLTLAAGLRSLIPPAPAPRSAARREPTAKIAPRALAAAAAAAQAIPAHHVVQIPTPNPRSGEASSVAVSAPAPIVDLRPDRLDEGENPSQPISSAHELSEPKARPLEIPED